MKTKFKAFAVSTLLCLGMTGATVLMAAPAQAYVISCGGSSHGHENTDRFHLADYWSGWPWTSYRIETVSFSGLNSQAFLYEGVIGSRTCSS
jgi:hypothetical protein